MVKSCHPTSETNFQNGHTPKSTSHSEFDTDEFYNNLIKESPYIPGDKCELIAAKDIPWMNPDLLKEGIQFGQQNLFSVAVANTYALSLGFSVKPESVVLLRSGKFHTSENAFRRYLSTARRIASWFRYGLAEDSPAISNIKIVRGLHSHYAKSTAPLPPLEDMELTPEKAEIVQAIRDDMDFIDTSDAPSHLLTWDPPLPISQLDMALTQFGFIGLIYLFPKSLGIKDISKMEGFLHFWAVVGRLLGLEDRFNLGLHHSPELFKKIYFNVAIASLKSSDETVICLQNSLINGLSKRLFLLSLKSWIYYGLEHVEGYEGKNLWKLMSFYDKICFYSLKGYIKVIYHSKFFRVISNIWTVLLLHLAFWIYLPESSCPYQFNKSINK